MKPFNLDYYISEVPKSIKIYDLPPWEAIVMIKERLITIKNKLKSFESDRIKVANSYIEDDCYIGDFCLVRDSYICKGAVLGAFCEISNSLVLPRAMIPHHNFISHSIIGCDVKIGGNCRTAVWRFDREKPSITINGKKIISSNQKIGILVGDKTKIGSSVVFTPLTLVGKNCRIYPFQLLSGFIKEGKTIARHKLYSIE